MVNDPVAFAKWHLGEIEWGDALRSGGIEVTGPRELARALPNWSTSPQRHRTTPEQDHVAATTASS